MKYLDEYLDRRTAERYDAAISDTVTRSWTLMEVCGGQTNCIVKNGISGELLRGIIPPDECGCFGGECTPENPPGAPMVSSEGACPAYYRYGRGGND